MKTYNNTRFTLMAFPQKVDASGKLSLNILFIPRNISPLEKVNSVYTPATHATPPFADVKPEFSVVVVNNPDEFPGKIPGTENPVDPDPLDYSPMARKIYATLKETKDGSGNPKYFDIDETRSSDIAGINPNRAPMPEPKESSVKKYLPVTYRKAFNYTSPRVPNAVTDDSYSCALRDQMFPAKIVRDDKVSWGKVYAHLLRQPLLARKGGLLYETAIQLNLGDFSKGGWIYVTVKPGSPYADEQAASLTPAPPDPDGPFIKQYAARIPALKTGEERPLFASVLFPVMAEGEDPAGSFDDVFMEAAQYNEGFAAIVHANQPVSQNLIKEEQDGIHPQKEIGIRLGWDDEQILVWYLRQLAVDDNIPGDRLDAPLGVTGYHADVWNVKDARWESLTGVTSKGTLTLESLDMGIFEGELPYQVYPVKIYGPDTNYWLPLYFANWNDGSLVIPDSVATTLYGADHPDNANRVAISNTYNPSKLDTRLLYGNHYKFRIRMSDISGGGPTVDAIASGNSPSQVAEVPFKRYIAPNNLRIVNDFDIVHSKDEYNFTGDVINVQRPLLGYPAVVYTGKYADPVSALKAASAKILADAAAEAFGIPDPDVIKAEIKVEVETLQMDNLASDTGRDNYITLYTTSRYFDPGDFASVLDLVFEYKDIPVLRLCDPEPFPDPADNATIIAVHGPIILPKARNVRVTLRAAGEGDNTYWGQINEGNHDLDSRYGKTTVLMMRRYSKNEKDLFAIVKEDPHELQGIYLRPDPVDVTVSPYSMNGRSDNRQAMPDIVQRLAKQLDVECKGLTLTARNGERLVFWCSSMLRHTMAPDNSSITFAGKNELPGHWLVCTSLVLNRDWTWDGLETSSMIIDRQRCRGKEGDLSEMKASYVTIGDVDMRKTASFQAIQQGDDTLVHREKTRILLIDVIDQKPVDDPAIFPDIDEVQYRISPCLVKDEAGKLPDSDAPYETHVLKVPVTINPAQTPKILSAGIALSPFNRNAAYSQTEARKRFLWLEFEEAPENPDDDLFCRTTAYAPDQLLSNNNPGLMAKPDESPLPVDPEFIRVVTPFSGTDFAGLNAMQKMEKSLDAGRHFYLLPTPPGLHPESPELFGMFTYEFRYGHSDRIWSTAQGRFGRVLEVAGLQHPAPNLLSMVQRDENRIMVSAPYAKAVFKGKNVTSKPPRTSLWCLLYAQVKQADGLDYRNILLDEIEMKPRPLRTYYKTLDRRILEEEKKGNKERAALLAAEKREMSQLILVEREGGPYAFGSWFNEDVAGQLELYGLPQNSPLSILCVEVFGQITNIREHITAFTEGPYEGTPDMQQNQLRRDLDRMKAGLVQEVTNDYSQEMAAEMQETLSGMDDIVARTTADPLKKELGLYRILRTSPLTEVPFVCCTTGC